MNFEVHMISSDNLINEVINVKESCDILNIDEKILKEVIK